MRNELKIASFVLGGMMFLGCDSKDNTAAPTTPPPPAASSSASDAVKNATSSVQNAATDAQTKATSAMGSATDTANSKLKEVGDLIAQKKYDAADAALKEVEGMKASLPDALQQQVTALRTQLDAAKAANGMTMPKMPGQ